MKLFSQWHPVFSKNYEYNKKRNYDVNYFVFVVFKGFPFSFGNIIKTYQ